MDSFIFLLLLGVFTRVHGETHELQYIYTALSKPIEMPGVYKFTAMGILDGRPIDKYNSQEKVKKPVQDWMRKNPKDYWEKGTQSRKSKEQWFDVNVNILMDRMRQNQSDVHILQWTHGCKAEVQHGGGLKYVEGFDQYGYDGEDFLSFNAADKQWVAPVTEAFVTKKKWDAVDILNLYTQGYLEKECVQSLERFLKFQEEFFGRMDDSPPEVHVWAMESFQPGKLILVCLATEFFPKDVKVDIFRGKLRLDESDGVTSSGVRPNGVVVVGKGETFQLRKTLEIEKSDTSEYSCVVNHRTLSVPLEIKWDGKVTSDVATPINLNIGVNIGGIIGGIIGAIITLLVVGLLCYCFRNRIRGFLCPEKSASPPEVVVLNGGPGGQENGQNAPLLQDGQKTDAEPMDEKAENGSSASVDSGKGTNSSGSSEEDVRKALNKGGVNGEHVPLTNGLKPDAGTMNGRENGEHDPLLQDGQKTDAEPTDGQQGADVV